MEWMLQVVDEMDDVLGAVRHRCLGVNAELGALLGSRVTAGTLAAAVAAGRDAVVSTAAVVLNVARR